MTDAHERACKGNFTTRRLRRDDYLDWRPLGQASQLEQNAPKLTHWTQPWQNDPLIWGIETDQGLIGYALFVEMSELLLHHDDERYLAFKTLADLPQWGIADLYVSPKYRRKGLAEKVLRRGLSDLGVKEGEALGLSMPLQEMARTPLKRALGAGRPVLGYAGRGYVTIGAYTIDALVERSKSWKANGGAS